MNLLSDYGFLGWIVIGALAGIIAKAVMPGPALSPFYLESPVRPWPGS